MANLVNFLKQSDIFYQFTPTQLELVANICQEVVYNANDLIFQENSGSKELYVILQGEVDILINRGGGGAEKHETAVARLRRGQSFGEVALVDEGLRSASARLTKRHPSGNHSARQADYAMRNLPSTWLSFDVQPGG